METVYYQSPIGMIKIDADDCFIRGLNFIKEINDIQNTSNTDENLILKQCMKELDEYFSGSRKVFDVKAKNKSGTEFRHKVWDVLTTIDYATTKSYKDVAQLIGNPKAVRAVGSANHNNNISIIIPCHRVIGTSGSLTGYGGEIWRKEWLLEHEKKHL